MLSSSADYKTAIAATDREIRGYLQFSNGFVLRGSGGLISFKSTQTAMDAERFCVGSVTSAFCEASFFNSGLDGSGVSLANSYFDAYCGVVTGNPPDAETDYTVETLMATRNITTSTGATQIPDINLRSKLVALSDGTEVVFDISGTDYVGIWDDTLHSVTVTDGTLNYTVSYTGNPLALLEVTDANEDDVAGTYTIGLSYRDYQVEYKCLGRFYISEITRDKATTRIVGYDVAGRLSMNYVCTVTPDPDDGYLVMDVLNDIIDQTGVNGGTHFTTFGDSVYVPEIYEGNCRQQWGWLCTLARTEEDGAEWSGTRETQDLGYMKAYYLGNGEVNPYSVTDTTTYLDGLNVGDDYTISSFTTGTSDNPIVSGNGLGVCGLNPYIDQTLADAIEGNLDSFTYTPVTLRWRGDPCLDVMDEISVTTGAGDTYTVVAMKIVTTFNGGLEQTVNCWGDSEAFYELSTSPTDSKITTVSNMLKEIAQSIETADGGVITKILDTDGTWKELVIANNQDLSQATSVWRWNINGLAHSTQYSGGTYSFALDDQGRLIANVIQTGILQDANGNNSWNLDTGEFIIRDGSMTATYTDPKVFYRADYDSDPDVDTNQDVADLRAIILRGAPFSQAELDKYDFNNSGTLTNADLVKLRNMIIVDKDIVRSRTAVIDPRLETVIKVWNTEFRDTPQYTTEQTAKSYNTSSLTYDASGNAVEAQMELEATGIYGYYNNVNRTTVTPDGKLWQYDGNGVARTYLEYGDIYLYNNSGTQMLHINSNGRIYPLGSSDYIYDFVVERSTSGSWNWRKWNSGLQEAWHTGTFTRSTSQWTAWGSMYVATATAAESFPSGITWTSAPREWATLHSSTGSGWLTNQGTETTTSASQRYEITRPNKPSSSVTFYIHYYFQGFWK